MFLDDVLDVVVDVAAADEAGLGVGAHGLRVEIHQGPVFADQPAVLLEIPEILGGLDVDGVGVEVRAGRQIDLRVVDVQERHRVAFRELGGFGRVHGVVGGGGDSGDDVGAGPQGFIGMDAHGGTSFTV